VHKNIPHGAKEIPQVAGKCIVLQNVVELTLKMKGKISQPSAM